MDVLGNAVLPSAPGMGFDKVASQADDKAKDIIEIRPKNFKSTYLLDEETQEGIRRDNHVQGFGEADYAFETAEPGWWEFWAEGGSSPFDLIMDGCRLIHSPIASGVWEPRGKLEKMLNVFILAGKHVLRISRPEPWGIPNITRMQFRRSKDLSGMVRVEPAKDCLVLRKGEELVLKVTAGRTESAQILKISSTLFDAKKPLWSKDLEIPAGSDLLHEGTVNIPGDAEGVFDLNFSDAQGHPVDRTIQFLVVDVENAPPMDKVPKRELVQEIICARQAPDYSSDETKIVESQIGAYRESGDKGRMGFSLNSDWFAYKLDLPTVQEPYLAEIEYPDDDERVVLISIIESAQSPYSLSLGYISGGVYSLSNKMLTQQFFFYPRDKDPRVLFQTWRTGMKAAAAKIKVYRLASMPKALKVAGEGRIFGGYQEENIRFTTHYGSTPDGYSWSNFNKAAERVGMHYKFLGANLWQQTIGNYQMTLWPCDTIKGYGVEAEGGWCVIGPDSLKDPLRKDIMRMQLLVCEKFGIDYLGELHLPVNQVFRLHMDKVFGGNGTLDDCAILKPWLAVSKSGECGMHSLIKPYWNVFYPGVQDWAASVISEIAGRYKDSPAFKGLVIRLMHWCFSSWQTVPSIGWGYEDFTTDLFQKETGMKISAPEDSLDRFARRYEWLMANAYDEWVGWRCLKIYEYHCRLAKILTDARPDLKLYLSAYGPDFSGSYTEEEFKAKGWDGLIKESGIDLSLYNKNPSMAVQAVIIYPSSSSQSKTPLEMAFGRESIYDVRQTYATAHECNSGTACTVHLDADSFEGDICGCRDLGYTEQFEGANKVPNGNGVLNPAGIHFLERFAEAMAAGNMTIISDGSHGYDQQQPQHLQPFLAEYRSLPAIGMTPLEHDADPVAAWQGTGDDGRMYFYLANRLDQTVDIRLRFEGDASPIRLSTKEVVKIDGGVLKLTIKPYQFLSFEGGPASVKITGLRATVSESIRSTLLGQITFSESLAFGEMPEPTLLKLSPVEIKKVKDRLVEAKMALEKGRVVSARRMLLSYDMTKLYEAFHAYPPGLLYKKNPHPPKGAMIPHTLRDSTIPASFPTRVLDASKLAPSLSGVGALDWEGSSILIGAIEQFSNRYRLELAYVAGDSFSAPSISIDGKAIPESAMVKEETETCGRVIGLAPLSLIAGAHKIEISKATGSDAAILFLSLEPVPRDLVASDWLVIGPFAGSDDPRVKGSLEEMMDKKYQPETSKDFTAQCEGLNGRKLAWQHPQFSSDYVDLYKLTGEHKCRISYAACHIFSPTERDAQIKFGVDYWAKIWVNGEEVFNNVDQHKQPPHKDEYAIPVKLQGGDNEIMVKIHAGIQGNGFWMSVSDPGDLNLNLLIE